MKIIEDDLVQFTRYEFIISNNRKVSIPFAHEAKYNMSGDQIQKHLLEMLISFIENNHELFGDLDIWDDQIDYYKDAAPKYYIRDEFKVNTNLQYVPKHYHHSMTLHQYNNGGMLPGPVPHKPNLGSEVGDKMEKLFPALDTLVSCPVLDCTSNKGSAATKLTNTIIHLNDGHQWTREQIADWLESLDVDLQIKEKENVEG